MMRAAFVLVAIAGCSITATRYAGSDGASDDAGDDAAGDEPPAISHSGSRLQLVQIAYDATKLPHGIHDSQLDVDCGATKWDDGNSYCAPFDGLVVFEDSACTMPVIERLGADTGAALYGTQSTSTGVSHLFLAGAAKTLPQVFTMLGPTCTPLLGVQVFEVAREVMPSELVPMTITNDDVGAYSSHYVHGADGFVSVGGNLLHDTALDLECNVNSQGPGYPKSYCIPTSTQFTGSFSDSACAQPIVPTPAAGVSSAAVFAPPFQCPVISEIHTIGPSIGTPAQLYAWDPSTNICTLQGAATQSYRSLDPATTLPELDRRPMAQPGHRLENGSLVLGSQRFPQSDFFDTNLGMWCSTRTLLDGQLLCAPENSTVQSLFSDPACTTPKLVADWATRSCATTIAPFAVESVGGSFQVRPVLKTTTGPLYQMTTSCLPVTNGGLHFYSPVGDPLPLSTLATGTIVTEPTR